MKFFNENTARFAQDNDNYRTVLFTTTKSQLVLMALTPGQQIPQEVHPADQIIVIVAGNGQAVINGEASPFSENSMLIIPAGTQHTIKNTGSTTLKLYTVYTPPQHTAGTVQKTQEEEPTTY